MDVVEDNARREALAQRMSKLLGLPITNIQLLMPLIEKEDLEKLENLPDDQFLSQATKIINSAQRKQFEEEESAARQAENGPAAPSIKPMAPAAPLPPDVEDSVKEIPKKKKIGLRSSSDAEEASPADEEEAAGPDMPAAFQRQVKKEKPINLNKRMVIILTVAAVAVVVVLAGVAYFLMDYVDRERARLAGPRVKVDKDKVVDDGAGGAVVYTHEWALKLQSTFDIPVADMTAADGPLTVECWIKPLPGTSRQTMLITGEGSDQTLETFRFSFTRNDSGDFEAEFSIPASVGQPTVMKVPRDVENRWVHIAGVYDPLTTGQIQLYVGGFQVDREKSAVSTTSVTTGYRIISTVAGDTEGFLLDEVRVTNSPVYLGDFTPSRLLRVQNDTTSMLHLEKWDDGMIRDAAAKDRQLALGGGEFVNIKEEIESGEFFMLQLAPVLFPPELLAELEKRKDKVFAMKFMNEWKNTSRSDRIDYLRSLNFPEQVLEQMVSSEPTIAPTE